MRKRMRGGERQRGVWVQPGWLMSCWRIILTWAGREWEGRGKGERAHRELNLPEWRRKLWEGGRKLIPPATWRRGARVVVGSTLWRAVRAVRADHVTMERWRDGSRWECWGSGEGVRGCQERRHWDDSFQMYGGTPAVVYYWELEFDDGANSIKKPLTSSSHANYYGESTNYNANPVFSSVPLLFLPLNSFSSNITQIKLRNHLLPSCG